MRRYANPIRKWRRGASLIITRTTPSLALAYPARRCNHAHHRYASAVTGSVGTGPITGAAVLQVCGEVIEKIFVVDAAGPLTYAINDATSLTTAIGDLVPIAAT